MPSNKSAKQRLNWFEFYLGRKNRWSNNTLGGGPSLCAARPLLVAASGAHLPAFTRTDVIADVIKRDETTAALSVGEKTLVLSALAAGAQNDRAPSVQ